jgi:hypothetical protein
LLARERRRFVYVLWVSDDGVAPGDVVRPIGAGAVMSRYADAVEILRGLLDQYTEFPSRLGERVERRKRNAVIEECIRALQSATASDFARTESPAGGGDIAASAGDDGDAVDAWCAWRDRVDAVVAKAKGGA